MPSNIEEFRVDLRDEYLDYYRIIKDQNQIRKKIDVFRHALKTTYEVEMEDTTPYTIIDPSLKRRINQLVSREDVRAKFHVYRYEGFLKKGIELLLEKIENYTHSRSILHWDVLNSLDGDQKEVALVLKELLFDNPYGEATFEDIKELLDWRDERKLKKILDDFVYQNLLESEILGKKRVYHASLKK